MTLGLRWLAPGLLVLALGCPGPDGGEGASSPDPAADLAGAADPAAASEEPLDIEAIERAAREAAEAITPQNADEELRRIEFELEVEDPGYETASGYRGGVVGDG